MDKNRDDYLNFNINYSNKIEYNDAPKLIVHKM